MIKFYVEVRPVKSLNDKTFFAVFVHNKAAKRGQDCLFVDTFIDFENANEVAQKLAVAFETSVETSK